MKLPIISGLGAGVFVIAVTLGIQHSFVSEAPAAEILPAAVSLSQDESLKDSVTGTDTTSESILTELPVATATEGDLLSADTDNLTSVQSLLESLIGIVSVLVKRESQGSILTYTPNRTDTVDRDFVQLQADKIYATLGDRINDVADSIEDIDVDSSTLTDVFTQNGNAFAATAVLGTTDTQSLAFITDNTTRMTLSTNGNVGIGTTSPAATLHVEGTLVLNGTYPVGTNNIALGSLALASTSLSGGANTAIGWSALTNNTSGSSNTALGYRSLVTNSTGGSNVAVGLDALRFNTTGSFNTVTGLAAMEENTTGQRNTASGYLALRFNTIGDDNTGMGYRAAYKTSSGSSNLAVGNDALWGNQTGSFSTAVGHAALNIATGGSNTAFGYRAGSKITSGIQNIVVGYGGTTGITTGSNNIIIGQEVRAGLTATGDNQLNIGNLIFGTGLASSTIYSTGKVGIGTAAPEAKLDVSSTDSIVAQFRRSGDDAKVYLRREDTSIADGNVLGLIAFTGDDASATNTIGASIAAIATQNWTSGNAGSSLYFYTTQAGTETQMTRFALRENGDTYMALNGGNVGIGTTTLAQKLVVAGNARFSGVTSGAYAADLNLTADGTLTTSASDRSLKTDERLLDTEATLAKLLELKPKSFVWKSTKTTDIGFIAQDVEPIFPELVFTNPVDNYKGINYSRFSALIIAALQEIASQITSLFEKDTAQDDRIEVLEKRIRFLEAQQGVRERELVPEESEQKDAVVDEEPVDTATDSEENTKETLPIEEPTDAPEESIETAESEEEVEVETEPETPVDREPPAEIFKEPVIEPQQ